MDRQSEVEHEEKQVLTPTKEVKKPRPTREEHASELASEPATGATVTPHKEPPKKSWQFQVLGNGR